MQAEVISIGDELTSGQRLDTNSQWLSQRLGELGVRTVWHSTVADDLAANVAAFRQALERADIVISTGGLGPTADDLTRQALADAVGQPLELDAASLGVIEAMFARRNRPMPERNKVQAYFPAGSQVIPNPNGTAPGIEVAWPRLGRTASHAYCLPGVPAELFPMWHETVVPAIRRLAPAAGVVVHRRIKCFGAGESEVEQRLPDLIRRGRDPQVGITASDATITLRITAAGPSVEACHAAIEPTAAIVYECLGPLVYGEEDDELQDVVLRRLTELGKTLSVAEWGTTGLLGDWLGEAAVVEGGYLGDLEIGDARLLTAMLGPELGDLEPTSLAMAEQLATAWRERSGADYALAIGAFPSLPEHDQPPHQVHIALASERGVKVKSPLYAGQPSFLRRRTAKQALDLLRLQLD
jgi:nicotinamide-nucleotide amidase